MYLSLGAQQTKIKKSGKAVVTTIRREGVKRAQSARCCTLPKWPLRAETRLRYVSEIVTFRLPSRLFVNNLDVRHLSFSEQAVIAWRV
jgi:hypothetical protein